MEVNAEKYTCMFNFLEQNGGQNQKIKMGNRSSENVNFT
jgi:hypothetical protein